MNALKLIAAPVALGLALVAVPLAAPVASAAELSNTNCQYLLPKDYPDWVKEMQPQPQLKQTLAALMAVSMVFDRFDKSPPEDPDVRCGCMTDHVDWDEVRAAYPDWYRLEPPGTGRLFLEYLDVSKRSRYQMIEYADKYCPNGLSSWIVRPVTIDVTEP